MTLNPVRGMKFGAGTAACFAIATPINNYLRDEPSELSKIIVGVVFVFLVFGLIGTLTDKIGSDVGDA